MERGQFRSPTASVYPTNTCTQLAEQEREIEREEGKMAAEVIVLSEDRDAPLPSIVDFYSGRDIFITGATGFMGKCLLEKLLRSVPDLGSVFVLTREKKGKSPEQRTKELLSSPLFERLHTEQPAATEKVVPVIGDIEEPELGLKREDQELLQDRVSVVFHLAATIHFISPIREALTKNVAAVSELIKLCRGMKHLKSLIHVSSAYSQCNKQDEVIEEISYPTPVSPQKLLGLLDWMNDEQLDALAPTLTTGYPNTYTFTKALAEQVVLDEAKDLPVAIYRPSIVAASLNEPVQGWVDNLQGPTGLLIAVGKGFLRVIRCDEYKKTNFVPVDLVNNLLIAIGWITGVNPSPTPLFYNYSSSTLNPMNWVQLNEYFMKAQELYPMNQIYRRPWVFRVYRSQFYSILNFFLHLFPGFIGDTILRLMQKKPFFIRMYSKLNRVTQHLQHFMKTDWRWTHENSDKLYAIMSPEDREMFDFDIRKMKWQTYLNHYSLGLKQYLLHEDLADLPKARQNIKRLRNMRLTFNFIIFLIATRVVYQRSQVARQLWNGMWDFCVHWLAKLGIPAWHSF